LRVEAELLRCCNRGFRPNKHIACQHAVTENVDSHETPFDAKVEAPSEQDHESIVADNQAKEGVPCHEEGRKRNDEEVVWSDVFGLPELWFLFGLFKDRITLYIDREKVFVIHVDFCILAIRALI
jgi:hypothetical protein